MSHEHDEDDKGKPRIVGRPTVEVPMTEATGRAIIKKLDELSDQMTMVVTSIMDLEQQARVTGLDGEADGANGAEGPNIPQGAVDKAV